MIKRFWGIERSTTKQKRIAIFSTEKKLVDWIKDGRGRIKIMYSDAIVFFKNDPKLLNDFVEKEMDKEEVVFDELDELRVKYLKKRHNQLENYIQ